MTDFRQRNARMTQLLKAAGVPYKEVEVFGPGASIIVTCWSHDAACKFVTVLNKFAKNVKMIKTIGRNQKAKIRIPPSRRRNAAQQQVPRSAPRIRKRCGRLIDTATEQSK